LVTRFNPKPFASATPMATPPSGTFILKGIETLAPSGGDSF